MNREKKRVARNQKRSKKSAAVGREQEGERVEIDTLFAVVSPPIQTTRGRLHGEMRVVVNGETLPGDLPIFEPLTLESKDRYSREVISKLMRRQKTVHSEEHHHVEPCSICEVRRKARQEGMH